MNAWNMPGSYASIFVTLHDYSFCMCLYGAFLLNSPQLSWLKYAEVSFLIWQLLLQDTLSNRGNPMNHTGVAMRNPLASHFRWNMSILFIHLFLFRTFCSRPLQGKSECVLWVSALNFARLKKLPICPYNGMTNRVGTRSITWLEE